MYTIDHGFVERCLIAILEHGAEGNTAIQVGEDKTGRGFFECTTEDLNTLIHSRANQSGIDYEGTPPQLAVLFSAKGGRLFVRGWRRQLVRVVRGVRVYRILQP